MRPRIFKIFKEFADLVVFFLPQRQKFWMLLNIFNSLNKQILPENMHKIPRLEKKKIDKKITLLIEINFPTDAHIRLK
ncbi:hypothetical protein BpHYR1_051433 [Brachionus plicatilis]|uniref:Uncharacterized protein n=1 Tax=Brachionus plicatilis TaxID=10195 RepID=A0A3M7SM69_BRAPC|nr:hypothetical protein BpHYR1_051433 [Brachionus plicatilis]